MATLETRIAALEGGRMGSDGPRTIILVPGVPAGHPVPELHRLTGGAGEHWERQPGETRQSFISRASGEATRNRWGFALLAASGERHAKP